MTSSPVVLLDRDGVINEDSRTYVKNPGEWIPIPGSLDAMARLSQHGYRICVITNQSGLARGLFTLDDLRAVNEKFLRLLREHGGRLEAILFCPHSPDDNCLCRKPRPGLLFDASRRLGCGLAGVPFVGDSLSDIQAAQAAGARPILVTTGKGKATLANAAGAIQHVPVFSDLSEFAQEILRQKW